MRILICNERFLFRFGVDRVLLILGKYFRELGHEVVMMGNKLDEKSVESCTDRFIEVPEAPEYFNANEFTERWLVDNWKQLFNKSNNPDIAFVAGWPFYSAIPLLKEKCGYVVFQDHGAVPTDNMEGGLLRTQQKLQKLRLSFLKEADEVIAVSQFLEETQSKKDVGFKTKTSFIHNGVNHMQLSIWKEGIETSDTQHKIKPFQKFKDSKGKIIFLLGRWEPDNYKNSASIYRIVRTIKQTEKINLKVFILANSNDMTIPEDLCEEIVPLGYISDEELEMLMEMSDIGISVSLWEGFNLPLGEMQLLKKPVYVFDKGAHKEVVAHPYFLCSDEEEMSSKLVLELKGNCPLSVSQRESSYLEFKNKFKWKDTAVQLLLKFNSIITTNKIIIIDVTNACHDTANSGVMRVTRKISRLIQERVETVFVLWDDSINSYVFPYNGEVELLCAYGGPEALMVHYRTREGEKREKLEDYLSGYDQKDKIIVLTETVNHLNLKQILEYAKSKSMTIVSIFYDAIPVKKPEYIHEEVRLNHISYMTALSRCDIVMPIAKQNGTDLLNFWSSSNITTLAVVQSNLLAGELDGKKRVLMNTETTDSVKILFVSTLEPRKNHIRFLQACELLKERHPSLKWELTMVGNRYVDNQEIPNFVEEMSRKYNNIQWLGVVDDNTLFQLYNECTFTVYPSIIEGYGMPIMESLWNGKVCMCANSGVMSELAEEGGCYTVDVTNTQDILNGLYELISNTVLRENLQKQAVVRDIRTWNEYTLSFLDIVHKYTESNKGRFPSLEQTIYKNCLLDNWQMNDSERMSLIGLLSIIKPSYSIEIGTFMGGSLSLIAQHSDWVFSLDIDSTIPERFSFFKNVSFLTGESKETLPLLLDLLTEENIAVDFLLIDGDHSESGVRNDINTLKNYIPLKPLFVMFHDSFNPGCRKGIMTADWMQMPYLKYLDIDFVPGRIIESGGGYNELCGGLGLAYFTPEEQQNPIDFKESAKGMQKIIEDYSRKVAL